MTRQVPPRPTDRHSNEAGHPIQDVEGVGGIPRLESALQLGTLFAPNTKAAEVTNGPCSAAPVLRVTALPEEARLGL